MQGGDDKNLAGTGQERTEQVKNSKTYGNKNFPCCKPHTIYDESKVISQALSALYLTSSYTKPYYKSVARERQKIKNISKPNNAE